MNYLEYLVNEIHSRIKNSEKQHGLLATMNIAFLMASGLAIMILMTMIIKDTFQQLVGCGFVQIVLKR